MLENRLNSVSLYSFLEKPAPAQQTQPKRGLHSSSGGPKIITVKGITPPHSRRQRFSKLGVEKINYTFSISSDEDVGQSSTALTRSTSAGTALSSKKTPTSSAMNSKLDNNAKQASCEMEEDVGGDQIQPWNDESLETNILEESTNRLDLTSIVSNLDKFVLGLLTFSLSYFSYDLEPCRKNVTMKCRITRDKKGMDKGMVSGVLEMSVQSFSVPNLLSAS